MECASNNSTAIHILGHGGKRSIVSEKGKIHKNIQKIRKSITIFENGTFIYVKVKHFRQNILVK